MIIAGGGFIFSEMIDQAGMNYSQLIFIQIGNFWYISYELESFFEFSIRLTYRKAILSI